jgi:hypothetical protein
MENTFDDFSAGDSYWLATSRVQDLLAMEIPASEWSTREGSGVDSTHPPNVGRQPDLGQSTYPR